LPLPSGRVAVFETSGQGAASRRLLAAETGLRDLAVDQETELRLAESPDVQVRQTVESRTATTKALPFVPGADRRKTVMDQVNRIEVANARPFSIQAEIRLYAYGDQKLVKADHTVEMKNGRPIFRVTVPANSSIDIRYQTTKE
jgi:hypothetical protein